MSLRVSDWDNWVKGILCNSILEGEKKMTMDKKQKHPIELGTEGSDQPPVEIKVKDDGWWL